MIRAHRIRWTRPAVAALAAATLILAGGACDLNDPDEIQNQANMALVRVQVFASSESRTPVPGVRMVVEAPPPDQGGGGAQVVRYQGPDVLATSGEDGIVEAYVFPGYDTENLTEVPTDPFTLPPPLFFADVQVQFLYNGQVLPFVTGLTIGPGRLYDLGSVFLFDDFGIVVD